MCTCNVSHLHNFIFSSGHIKQIETGEIHFNNMFIKSSMSKIKFQHVINIKYS